MDHANHHPKTNDPFTFSYTSGTVGLNQKNILNLYFIFLLFKGNPKGALITHSNIFYTEFIRIIYNFLNKEICAVLLLLYKKLNFMIF